MKIILGHMTEEASREIGNALLLLGLAALVVVAVVIAIIVALIRYCVRRGQQDHSGDPKDRDASEDDSVPEQ